MAIFGKNQFAVIFCSPELCRGAVFAKRNAKWALLRWGENSQADTLPGDRLKSLLKELGYSRDWSLYLCGNPDKSCFFNWESVAMPQKEQRNAVEMELNSALPGNMEEPIFQFREFAPGENDEVTVGVCAMPASSLDKVAAMLNRSGFKADEFVSPLLGVQPGEPEVVIDQVNPGFFFHNGVWKRVSGREKMLEEKMNSWREIMGKAFVLPPDLDVAKFIAVLLAARIEISGISIKDQAAFKILPESSRPLRYRHHIQLAVILGALLLLNLLWAAYLNFGGDYRNAREINSEIDDCRRKIASIQNRLKRNQKLARDMERVVAISAGEGELITKLAAFSRILPENVLVSNMRWHDNGVDLQLQSESANVNLPELLKPLSFWKIAQLQQRQMWNSDVTSINLRLTNASIDENNKGKKNTSRRRSGSFGGRNRR